MAELSLTALAVLILIVDYKLNDNTLFNPFFLVICPYIIITLLNNFYFVNQRFYEIKEQTIFLLMASMCLFYIGVMLGYRTAAAKKRKIFNPHGYVELNYKAMAVFVLVICLLRTAEVAKIFIQNGYTKTVANDFALLAPSGICAHLLLIIKPMCAILFYEWLINKKKCWIYFLIVLFASGITAIDFVKYHIISFVLIIFIYCSIKNRKYFVKMGMMVIILVCALFVANYILIFASKNESMSSTFYLNHMWKYVGGGTINIDPVAISIADEMKISVMDWLNDMFMSIPKMVWKGLTGYIDNSSVFDFGFLLVTTNGEYSNVVGFIGYIWTQKSFVFSIIACTAWGWVNGLIFSVLKTRRSIAFNSFASIFISYNLLSFFGVFFSLSGPWEEVLLVMPVIWLFTYKNANHSLYVSDLEGAI